MSMEVFFTRVLKYRRVIIAGFILLSLLSIVQLFRVQFDGDFQNLLPSKMDSVLATEKIEDIFGGTDLAFILIESDDVLNTQTLRRVEKISDEMKRMKGVDQVASLFESKYIHGEEDFMRVDPAVTRIPRNDEEREILRKQLLANTMVKDIVFSQDSTVTAVMGITSKEADDAEILEGIEKILEDNPGPEKTQLGGIQYTRGRLIYDMRHDMLLFLPFGLLLMLFFLFFFFRQKRGVILPFIVVVFSIEVSYGLLVLLGWSITLPLVLLPVILIAVANDYGIHIVSRYQEEVIANPDRTSFEVVKSVVISLGKPVIMTGITTIAGMLSLISHAITAAKELGVLAAFGVGYALFASLIFIPAVLSLLKVEVPQLHKNKNALSRMLTNFSSIAIVHNKRVIITSLVFVVVLGLGAFFINVNADPNGYYAQDDPVNQTSRVINEKLGGSQNVSLLISGDIKSPELMQKIDKYEKAMKEFPYVGNTSGISSALLEMSKAINLEGDEFYNVIPDDNNAIAQYLELYNISGDPEDFEKLVDFDYQNAQLLIRINDTSTSKVHSVVSKVKELTRNDENVTGIGGWAVQLDDLARLTINGQLLSLLVSLFLVAVLLMILFKSLKGGLFAAIPLGLSLIVVFGIMGYTGITLNIATVLFSSIMVGIGIDYTIHFLWRYKEERALGKSYEDAIRITLLSVGRGILFNAFSVILGFIVLIFSSMQPIQFFGICVLLSISSCLIGALIIMPALCLRFKPKFLEPKI